MRLTALIVEPEPGLTRTAAALQDKLETLDFDVVRVETAERATLGPGESGVHPQLVLLGPTLDRPVAAARYLTRRAPRTNVIFLRSGNSQALREELSSPVAMVGAPWTIVDFDNGGREASLEAAVRRVRQRAQTRTTLRRMNARLSAETKAELSKVSRYTASQRFLASIIEQAKDAIIATTPDGTIVAWNEAAATLLGIAWDEAIGRHAPEVAGGEWRTRISEIIHDAARTTDREHGARREELTLEVPGDSTVEVEVMTSRIIDQEGQLTGLSLVVRDITVRKALEERVQSARRVEGLGVLAGGIAHKFNNLLTGVIGSADLAAQELAPGSGVLEHLRNVREASMTAADLCRQILAFAGHATYQVRPVDLNETINGVKALLEVPLPDGVVLELDLAAVLPPLAADVGHLRQVLLALVTNACEAIAEGPGRVSIRTCARKLGHAEVECLTGADRLEAARYVVLEIADTGSGMSEDTLARVYEPFFTTKFTGRGLGLSEVLGIVRAHRGGLIFESAPGEGTTVRVWFPEGSR
jgi:PAS domain S-box-containing protein